MSLQTTLHSKPARGFTMMEILMTTAVSGMLFAAVGAISIYSGRSLTAMVNYADLEAQSRHALNRLSQEIRQVTSLTTISSNVLAFYDVNTQAVQYTFNSVTNTLVRTSGTNTEMLLTNCDTLTFHYYTENIGTNDYSLTATADPASCYVVSVNWVCSKQMFGLKMNTEYLQTATWVLRNR